MGDVIILGGFALVKTYCYTCALDVEHVTPRGKPILCPGCQNKVEQRETIKRGTMIEVMEESMRRGTKWQN